VLLIAVIVIGYRYYDYFCMIIIVVVVAIIVIIIVIILIIVIITTTTTTTTTTVIAATFDSDIVNNRALSAVIPAPQCEHIMSSLERQQTQRFAKLIIRQTFSLSLIYD
jgi:hypothetical protein